MKIGLKALDNAENGATLHFIHEDEPGKEIAVILNTNDAKKLVDEWNAREDTIEKLVAAEGEIRELAGVLVDEKPCSIEISETSKGDVSFKVKAYAETVHEARKKATETYRDLREEIRGPAPA